MFIPVDEMEDVRRKTGKIFVVVVVIEGR